MKRNEFVNIKEQHYYFKGTCQECLKNNKK